MSAHDAMFESAIQSLPLRHRGKVRDVYSIDDEHILIIATDRLSAFDVILPTPIPGKGRMLTMISNFWFGRIDFVPNHLQLATKILNEVLPDATERQPLEGRAVVARKCQAVPVEAIVRGYIIGSGWKDYQRTGELCGIRLPKDLRLAGQLPEPIFTPSTKAAVGTHDENVSFEHVVNRLGSEQANKIRDISLRIYREAAAYALERGIIIADTKFEFGLDSDGQLVLIDEVLTPDSSRFWPLDRYQPGLNPPSYDKQFVRDYLETLDWNKTAPGPVLPQSILDQTAALYREAQQRLAGAA